MLLKDKNNNILVSSTNQTNLSYYHLSIYQNIQYEKNNKTEEQLTPSLLAVNS